MTLNRRAFLGTVAGAGFGAAVVPDLLRPAPAQAVTWKKRLTGADLATAARWQVAGTDLGIPYVLENGSIGYLFGDTFSTPWPETGQDWRSPVMLRSNIDDGISFPETGRQLVSYMSIEHWNPGPRNSMWKTNYAGLAYSDNGNDFFRTNLKWWNNSDNGDPFQMWTMQRDGDYVYVFSVPSGRQDGAMLLRRVRWDRMFFPAEYEGWGWNGTDWGWGRPPTPILTGRFGEPSVRRLSNGTWVMCYLNAATLNIVTRTASGPDRAWTPEKVQVTWAQETSLYGGFIHPWSTSETNGLHLMVSTWKRDGAGHSTAYHMSQYVGTV